MIEEYYSMVQKFQFVQQEILSLGFEIEDCKDEKEKERLLHKKHFNESLIYRHTATLSDFPLPSDQKFLVERIVTIESFLNNLTE